ncbi:MAG: alpha/beta hydrolase [Polyangiaceae bacterium]
MLRAALLAAVACCACSNTTPERRAAVDASGADADVVMVEERVDSGDASLFVRRRGPPGAAQTLLLLHGGPGLSSRYLRKLEELASARRSVVSFDQRGAGQSTVKPDAAFDMKAYVDDVEAVRRHAAAERVVLVAHSWGGLIAWAYVAAHRSQVEGVVLIGALAATRTPNNEARDRLLAKVALLQKQGKIPTPLPGPEGDDCMPGVLAVAPAYFHDPSFPVPEDMTATTCSQAASNATNTAVFFPGYDFSSALDYAGPVHVVFGESDPLGTALGSHIRASLTATQASFDVIPKAGHSPWFESDDSLFASLRAALEAGQ